jgi:sialic acid synthase SpsE
MELQIGRHRIGEHHPTYFIADIAANHDGSLERAKELIHLAAEAGADAAKFQNFRAPEIVSDYGFRHLGGQQSHQANWQKSVFEVYKDVSIPFEWTPQLKAVCDEEGIEYFSAPYDFEAADALVPYSPAIKIGSGEVTWHEALEHIARKNLPVLLATGASDIGEVAAAVRLILSINPNLVLMQCNTNYTASLENFKHVHLNVLKTYHSMWPDLILGLSDHTPGHAAVLGAVALGARVIEKHFTDDNARIGPDHKFAINPADWAAMVRSTRELENALGSADKFVAGNEQDTVIIQRRCVRTARALPAGSVLTRADLKVLRPAPRDAIMPYDIPKLLGKRLLIDLVEGQELHWEQIGY